MQCWLWSLALLLICTYGFSTPMRHQYFIVWCQIICSRVALLSKFHWLVKYWGKYCQKINFSIVFAPLSPLLRHYEADKQSETLFSGGACYTHSRFLFALRNEPRVKQVHGLRYVVITCVKLTRAFFYKARTSLLQARIRLLYTRAKVWYRSFFVLFFSTRMIL